MEHSKAQLEAFYRCLYMAAFGAVALLGPMLIMSLYQGKVTSLATTSAFVVVVAVLLDWYVVT